MTIWILTFDALIFRSSGHGVDLVRLQRDRTMTSHYVHAWAPSFLDSHLVSSLKGHLSSMMYVHVAAMLV